MRRTHLRGHANILKRLLVHVGGFNLGLFMRTLFGVGTPRGLQGRTTALVARLVAVWTLMVGLWRDSARPSIDLTSDPDPIQGFTRLPANWPQGAF